MLDDILLSWLFALFVNRDSIEKFKGSVRMVVTFVIVVVVVELVVVVVVVVLVVELVPINY